MGLMGPCSGLGVAPVPECRDADQGVHVIIGITLALIDWVGLGLHFLCLFSCANSTPFLQLCSFSIKMSWCKLN